MKRRTERGQLPIYAVALAALALFGFDRGSCGSEHGSEGRTDGGIVEGNDCPGVICAMACENGFQRGPDGCEICACNEDPPGRSECDTDADCGPGMVCRYVRDDGGCWVDRDGNENCPGSGSSEDCACDAAGNCSCESEGGDAPDTPVPGGVCVPAEDPGVPPDDCGIECPEGTQCVQACGCTEDQENEVEICSCEVSCEPIDPPSAGDECETDADCEDGGLCVPTYTCMALGCPPAGNVCVWPGE